MGLSEVGARLGSLSKDPDTSEARTPTPGNEAEMGVEPRDGSPRKPQLASPGLSHREPLSSPPCHMSEIWFLETIVIW